MSRRVKVLICEDEALVAMDLEMTLNELGYFVIGTASSSTEAIRLYRELCPDLILMDVRLQGKVDGLETANEIQKRNTVPILFMTAGSEVTTKISTRVDWSVNGFLSKPFSNEELKESIIRLLELSK
jgi:DNA-binding response OmpR family regulator